MTFLQVAQWNWKKSLVKYLVAGSMEEGLLGEEFFGMIANVIFYFDLNYFSADLCVSEGVRNILCSFEQLQPS